jgi:aerobic carbon-monoxide dehydrogenase medium subunit
MKPARFAYVAPDSLAGVLEELADGERDAKVLAGGQSLIPMMNLRLATPDVLVDLRRVKELAGIHVAAGGSLRVGALVRQAELAADPRVRAAWPLLAEAVGHIGHPQIRNRGTVCGSLAHHDPAAELPAVAVALDARMTVAGPHGERHLPARDFFVSYLETALDPGEVLTAVTFPPPAPASVGALCEVARRRGDFALVGAVVHLTAPGGDVTTARIVLFGAGSAPVVATRAQQSLVGSRPGDAAAAARLRPLVAEEVDPTGDLHASATYRSEVAGVMAERALLATGGHPR